MCGNQYIYFNNTLSSMKNGPLPMTMLLRYQTNLTSHLSRNTWWGNGHLSTQHLQEMPASKLRQPKSLSSRNPKNCSNTQETFSALELQACSRYIFSGFELPPRHTNTIFVPSILYIHFDLEDALHHALTTTKRKWPRIWAKYNSFLLPTPISWHETLREVTQSSHTSSTLISQQHGLP
jgi:hypothetical protein